MPVNAVDELVARQVVVGEITYSCWLCRATWLLAISIRPCRKAVAKAKQAQLQTQMPSSSVKVFTPSDRASVTRTAQAAPAVRWSSRSLASQGFWKAFVRFDSPRIVPLSWPRESIAGR